MSDLATELEDDRCQVTLLPHVTVHGLWDAMRRAEVDRGDGQGANEEPPARWADVVVLDDRRSGRRGSLLVALN
jgi:hypothetical protein